MAHDMGRRIKQGRCALCGRGPIELTFHHLIPVTVHGNNWFRQRYTREQLADGLNLCRLCHGGLHLLFEEKELARHYNTREKLLAHARMRTHIRWVVKQKY
jgi:hypothetical protein